MLLCRKPCCDSLRLNHALNCIVSIRVLTPWGFPQRCLQLKLTCYVMVGHRQRPGAVNTQQLHSALASMHAHAFLTTAIDLAALLHVTA